MLTMRVVLGIYDKTLRERLLRVPDLNLKKASEYCRAAEVSRQQAGELDGSSKAVDFVSRSRDVTGKKKTADRRCETSTVPHDKKYCKYCGYEHAPKKCPAFGKKCSACQGLNHFSKVCRNKKVRKKVHEVTEVDEHNKPVNDHSDDEEQVFMDSLEIRKEVNAPPVQVAVYYESLCPDSIKFFTKQLYPTYEKLGKFMDITLIPYGKAKQIKTENGTWSFDCHHGPPECYGNKVQACALNYLTSVNDRMNFINCAMDKAKPKSTEPYPGEKCASKLGLVYEPIQTCVNSTDGDDKLAMFGDKTNALQPKLTSVPTIVFKSNYNKKDQELSVEDFEKAVCSYIGGNKAHKECKSAAVANQAAIFVSIMAAIFLKLVS